MRAVLHAPVQHELQKRNGTHAHDLRELMSDKARILADDGKGKFLVLFRLCKDADVNFRGL